MPSKDPRVDGYIAQAQPFAQPILKHLRKVVHAACPDVQETIKWKVPAFEYKGPYAGMAAFKKYCALVLWKSALLKEVPDARRTIEQLERMTSIEDLPSDKSLIKLLKAAAKLNDEGVKAPRVQGAARAPLKVPTYMTAALRKAPKAKAAFDAFSPSHRREYVEWLTGAKTEATRDRRLTTAIEWLSEGKSRNWKYERR